MSFRRLLPLVLLVVLAFTLMTYQSNRGILSPIGFVTGTINRTNGMLHSVLSSIREPFRKLLIRDEENRRLKEEVGRLVREQQGYRQLFFENLRMREILDFKAKEKRYVAAARIVSKGWSRWGQTLVIDKGKHDGIAKDMAVATPAGLIGKVSFTDDDYAYVLLITDINFSSAVKIQETRRDAILSGSGGGSCVLKYFPPEEDVKEGYVLITSGFDDLFPPEIPVGIVSKVSKKNTGMFREVEVRPFQDLGKLDEVVIVRR